MAGLRADQQALYLQDMYKAERESYLESPTKYDKVFKVVTAKAAAGDKSTQILGAGALTRHTAENQDVNFKSPVEGWSFYAKYHTFSDGINLTKEAVEDTTKLGNLLKDLAGTWGTSVRVEKETMGSDVFNRGGDLLGEWVFNGSHTGQADPSGDMIYDSEPLFNLTGNTRSTKDGGTYYNSIAALTLSAANFETLYNLITTTNNRDERDRRITLKPDTLLTQSGAECFKADRIINSTNGMPGGQLNDLNPYYKKVGLMDWDYLSDGAGTYPAFYLGNKSHKDFQFHERQMPEIRFFRDETNLGYKASINVRFGVMIKNWRVWHRGGGTAA